MNINTLQRLSCPSRAWDRYCDMYPDPWDYYDDDDFTEADMVSGCCKDEVNLASNGAKVCQNCYRFCTLDNDLSMDRLVERETAQEELF